MASMLLAGENAIADTVSPGTGVRFICAGAAVDAAVELIAVTFEYCEGGA
jgi:hypothetical protein